MPEVTDPTPAQIAETAGAAAAYYKFAADYMSANPHLLDWFNTRIPPEAAEFMAAFNEVANRK